jgi:hypothetical protein
MQNFFSTTCYQSLSNLMFLFVSGFIIIIIIIMLFFLSIFYL